MTLKKVKPLTGDTKWHSKFEPNMICSFEAILAWKSDAAAATDNDRKSDPYMSPSYAGDTISVPYWTIHYNLSGQEDHDNQLPITFYKNLVL